MAKLNPYTLKRPPEHEEERTFEENGNALSVTLRRSGDLTRKLLARERAADYARRYVTGEGDDGPSTVRAVDGRIPAVSAMLCTAIAALEVLECPAEGDAPYTFEEWAALCVTMPKSMDLVFDWASGLLDNEDDLKKRLRGGAGPVIRACMDKAVGHPELLIRHDALLVGIFRALRLMLPEADRPEDVQDLTTDFLSDVMAAILLDNDAVKRPADKAKTTSRHAKP